MLELSSVLENTKDHRLEIISEIKSDNLPVVIYGAGFTGQTIKSYLTEHGITNTVFAVDPQYILPPPVISEFIYSPSQIDEQFEQYHLVIGRMFNFEHNLLFQFKKAIKTHLLTMIGVRQDIERRLISKDFIKNNFEAFEKTYCFLYDDVSKEIFKTHLKAHLTFNGEMMLPFASQEGYLHDDLFTVKAVSSYIDCGVFDGTDILNFSRKYPNYKEIIGFEPEMDNYHNSIVNTNILNNVTLINKGCSDKKEKIRFGTIGNEKEVSSFHFSDDDMNVNWSQIDVDKIDQYTGNIAPVGLLKLDIEGSELSALKGAAETIKRDKPVLAICVYHKRDDLITIPQYIL
jgi:FkbM family methyltransferase